ncbi:hypothetical protein, partial [Asticcacaulis sp.]|uniref:hypothetical protein n=1 Tax=Asticcacaulis sp. TaxID=1872648 RepID=UPI00391A3450
GLSLTCVAAALRHRLAAAFVVLNPITLHLFMYTWSENLLLLCVCATFLALTRLTEDPTSRKWMALLVVGLIVGCFARYFFGPFAFILFLVAGAVYGRRLAIRVLPAFAVAGLVYLAYQHVNTALTGYPTGMPRLPAPESPTLLVRMFLGAGAELGWTLVIPLLLAIGLSWRQIRFERTAPPDAPARAAVFLLLAGAGFLLLGFVLRASTYYDSYDERTLGFGVVFVVAGLIARFVHLRRPQSWPVLAVLGLALFSPLYADEDSIPQGLAQLRDGHYRFAPATLSAFQRQGPPVDTVVSFALPATPADLWNVDHIRQFYYGGTTRLISPDLAPDAVPETAGAFVNRVRQAASGRCFVDFAAFPDRDRFDLYLNVTIPTDQPLFGGPLKAKPRMDPALKTYLSGIFQPGAFLPCAEVLALPQSQAIPEAVPHN